MRPVRSLLALQPSKSPHAAAIAAIVTFGVASVVFLARAGLQIGFDAVPGSGDEPEYDLLAMELAAGNGFRFDYDNADWRRPYANANTDGSHDVLLARHGAAATTYRPPLFPTVVAGLYSVFGRSFAVVRIFNCFVMAMAGAIAAWIVARRLGLFPGMVCGALFAVVEHRARYHAGLFLTESLASLFAASLALVLIRFGETNRFRDAAVAGLLAGLAILNRPLIALWLPVVVLLVGWLATSRRVAAVATVCLVTIAVVMPWSIRNSLLLGRFSPLGTHGQQNLAAAYSDEAVRQRGLWYWLDERNFFPAAIDGSRPGLERELARSELSQKTAMEWIQRNPAKIPVLAFLRAWQLWQPRMYWDALILGLAVLGFACWPKVIDRWVFAALLIANTLAVAVTWSVGGRFLVPLLPVLHVLATCGLCVALWAATTGRGTVQKMWLRNGNSSG